MLINRNIRSTAERAFLAGVAIFFAVFTSLQAARFSLIVEDKSPVVFPNIKSEGESILQSAFRARAVGLAKEIGTAGAINQGDEIILNLFPGAYYTATVDRVGFNVNGTVIVRGRLNGYPLGYFLASTTGKRSLVSINIPEQERRYRVISEPLTCTHYLIDVDSSLLDNLENGPSLIPVISGVPKDKENEQSKELFAPLELGVNDPASIDVMVVYTPAARNWADTYGGGIENVIAQSIAISNFVLDNNNTLITMPLVHMAEVNYVESGDSYTDVNRLTFVDGYMDEVLNWRNEQAADLVALFALVQDVGGLGWLLDRKTGRPNQGFCLVRIQQASSSFVHIHEMGHNMGAHHHKEQLSYAGPTEWTDWPENTWSAGWRWVGNDEKLYCSVMTYESGIYFADGKTHNRVAFFSDPEINYEGVAAGHPADGDNARTILEMKHVVAAYRQKSENPVLAVTPEYMNFGTDYIGGTFNINNPGSETLNWTIGAVTYNQGAGWITSVLPVSGTTTTEVDAVEIKVSRAGLAVGTYTATIPITSNGGNKEVLISMTVIELSGLTLDFGTAATVKTFGITNLKEGTMEWTIGSVAYNQGTGWITSVQPLSGTTTTEIDIITVTVNRASLPAGTYTATIPIYSNVGNSEVLVTMTVEGQTLDPVLTVNPLSLDFGTVDTSKMFDITNTGAGTLTWSIGTVEYFQGTGWITSVLPGSGTATTETDAVTVAVSRAGLSAGTYTAKIPVSSNGGTKYVQVSMTVEQQVENPVLTVNPASLDFGTADTSKIFNITNTGAGILTWSIGTVEYFQGTGWITSVLPGSGTATTETDTVTVAVSRTGLSAGTYTAKIFVNSNAGTKYVHVSMTVEQVIYPDTPVNVNPPDQAQDLSLTPHLLASDYSHPQGVPQVHSQWQVSRNAGFTSIAWDSGTGYPAVTQATVPPGRLSSNTTYYWRVRYESNPWSEWSMPWSFTTGTLTVAPRNEGQIVYVGGIGRQASGARYGEVVSTAGDIIVKTLSTEQEKTVVTNAEGKIILNPAFTSDGRNILFTAQNTAGADRYAVYLASSLATAALSGMSPIFSDTVCSLRYASLSLDSDASTKGLIAYTKDTAAETGTHELWVYNYATKKRTLLVQQTNRQIKHPVFLSDNETIAYIGVKDGIQNIFTVNASTGFIKQVTSNISPSPAYGRIISNSRKEASMGDCLIYSMAVPETLDYGKFDIYIYNLSDSMEKNVTNTPLLSEYEPAFYGDATTNPVLGDTLGDMFYTAAVLANESVWQTNYSTVFPMDSNLAKFECAKVNTGLANWGPAVSEVTAVEEINLENTRIVFRAAGSVQISRMELSGMGTSVVAWGNNDYGQCDVPAGLSDAVTIAAGSAHNVALKGDGTVIAWGNNDYGQCNVPVGLNNVTAVSAGDFHTVALRSNGTVIAWGRNEYGQCNVPVGLNNVTAVSAGDFHTVALKSDGTFTAWGRNDSGQCNMPSGLSDIIAIAAGGEHTVVLENDGTVVAWGYNFHGQCNIPSGLSDVTAIAAASGHSVALKSDGTVVAWGDNAGGKSDVPVGLSGVTAIAAGNGHTVALRNDGTVIAWGNNEAGQCNIPAGLSDVISIDVGDWYTVVLKNDEAGFTTLELTNSPTVKANPSIAGTGGTIVYDDSSGTQINRINHDGSGGRVVATLGTGEETLKEPSLSHDGRWVVYTRDGDLKTYCFANTGAGEQGLGLSLSDAANPSFNPDMTQVVFERIFDRTIWVVLVSINLDTNTISSGTPRQLTTAAIINDRRPSFSPDGRFIIFISDRWDGRDAIYVMDTGKGTSTGGQGITRIETTGGLSATNPFAVFGPVNTYPGNYYMAYVNSIGVIQIATLGLEELLDNTGSISAVNVRVTTVKPDSKFSWSILRERGSVLAQRVMQERAPANSNMVYYIKVDVDDADTANGYILSEVIPGWTLPTGITTDVSVDGQGVSASYAAFLANTPFTGQHNLRMLFSDAATAVAHKVKDCLVKITVHIPAGTSGLKNLAGTVTYSNTEDNITGNGSMTVGNPYCPFDIYNFDGGRRTDNDTGIIDNLDLLTAIDCWAQDAVLEGPAGLWPLDTENNYDGILLQTVDIWSKVPAGGNAGEYVFDASAPFAPEMYWKSGAWVP